MSHGFKAVNGNNQILISSDTRNLHLIGKAAGPTVTNSSSAYGGFKELTYTVNSRVTPVPFFTMPTGDYYGIVGVKNTSGTLWEIVMIRSGTGTSYPEVYVFADPRAVDSYDSHGMVVYRDDGTAAFDSRRMPLAVTNGTSVYPPSNPRVSIPGLSARSCGSGSDNGAFTPDQENGFYVGSMPTKSMFHYSSLAQAERQGTWTYKDESCTGIDAYGACLGYGTTDEGYSTYWAFYRGGIRRSGDNLYAGWICVLGGCYYGNYSGSGFFGIDLGGDSGSGGWGPYSNETINTGATAVIVGDGARYD